MAESVDLVIRKNFVDLATPLVNAYCDKLSLSDGFRKTAHEFVEYLSNSHYRNIEQGFDLIEPYNQRKQVFGILYFLGKQTGEVRSKHDIKSSFNVSEKYLEDIVSKISKNVEFSF